MSPMLHEALEARRMLSGAADGSFTPIHLIGCCCAMCAGSGAGGFIEEPLTAAEKRTLHGESRFARAIDAALPPVSIAPAPTASNSTQLTPGAAVGQQPTGALTGRIVFAAGGHGFTAANTTTGNWSTQRGLTNSMVEDMGNQDQMSQLVQYAWNAGATVVPTRPVGFQPNEVVMDNPSATFTGSWADGGAPINPGTVTFFSLTGPNVVSRYKFATASPTETAVARFTPNLPQGGFYPVYTWVPNSSNRVPDQLYRITHSGGKTEVKVDHQRLGKGWIYLGTYHFEAGSAGYVEISNKSDFSGAVVADGMRFGNGMGDINRGSGISGQTREDEASLYWIQKQAESTYEIINAGAITSLPASTYRGSNSTDQNANVAAPPRWAAYMNDSSFGTMADRLFLSYHSNAGNGTERGSIGLYNGNNDPLTKTLHQQEWALLVAKEVNDDLVALSGQLEFAWFNRTTTGQLTLDRTDIEFGEINNLVINNEFDATILEVSFHDNSTDAALMRDPKARQWIARSSVQGAVRYFNTYGGGALNFAPDAPTNVRAIVQTSGDVKLDWTPPVPAAGTGAAATGYVIESSENGYGFDGGILVSGGATNTYTILANQIDSDATYFRIISTNVGGASPASEVVGARRSPFGKSPVLIVNGFDRFDRTQDPRQTSPISGPGTSATFDRVRPRFSNSFDYVVQAGEAIEAFASSPVGFDSCQNEAIIGGQINLSSYDTVVWLSGEESTANSSFNATEQSLVTTYINGGGHFFASGSEIGWDLVAQNHGASFFNNTLRAAYVQDDSNTYSATGAGGSIFSGISLVFDNGAQFYDVDFPDVLGSSAGSTVVMNYVGGTGGGAATQWAGGSGQRVVLLGFPFETITTSVNRNAVMSAVLSYFGTANPAPTTAAPDLLASSDTGTFDTDNLTNRNNSTPARSLQFSVSGTTAGATVIIYSDGSAIGSAVASGSSTNVTTDGSSTLSDGSHLITATQQISGRPPSAASLSLAIDIDTVAPGVIDSNFAFATSHSLEFQFDENVLPSFTTADLLLENLTTSTTIPTATIALNYASNLATFTFPGQPNSRLSDGNYRATLLANGINDTAGNALASNHLFNFFFLTGDANHDGTVNLTDFNILAANFGQSPRNFTQGDFNYDGTVNLTDFNILAGKFGTALAPQTFGAAPIGSRSRVIDVLRDDVLA